MYQRLLAGIVLAAMSTTTIAAEFCVATLGDLQTALLAAGSNGQPDEIRVVQGLYNATSASFYSPTEAMGLDLSGGWDASCQLQASDSSSTVLDGGQATSLFAMSSASAANISLRNMTVRNGIRAEGGAGVFIRTLGNVTIESMRFEDNIHNGSLFYGGAVFVERADDVVVNDSSFLRNQAIVGAGIDVRSCDTLVVSASNFEQNINLAGGNGPHAGSAISVADASSAGVACRRVDVLQSRFTGNVMAPLALQVRAKITLVDNIFEANTIHDTALSANKLACGMLRADGDGLVQPADSGDVVIQGNSFSGNNGLDVACLWLLAEKISISPSTIQVAGNDFAQFDGSAVRAAISTECTFRENNFRELSGGTALQPWCSNVDVRRNRFIDVSARNYDQFKSGELVGGAPSSILVENVSEAITITDNLFVRNHSIGAAPIKSHGGAVRVELDCLPGGCSNRLTAFAHITNNTFVDNRSDTEGGALAIWSELDGNQNVFVYNNLFHGNQAAGSGEDVYFDNDEDSDFLLTGYSAHGNNLKLSSGGWAFKVPQTLPSPVTNVDDLSPVFANPGLDDYRLSGISPLLDRGDDLAPSIGTIDLDGNARILGVHVDIGALENTGDIPPPNAIFLDGFE